MPRIEGNQQHAQNTCTLRLRHAFAMERFGKSRAGHCTGARLAIKSAPQGLQQLACILKITSPEQRGPLAGKPIGGIRRHGVIRHTHPTRCGHATWGLPRQDAPFICILPYDHFVRRYVHVAVAFTHALLSVR